MSVSDRDEAVLRRALRVGALGGGSVAGLLLATAAMAGSGRGGVVALTIGFLVATLLVAAWLLVSIVVDLVADAPPGRRRVAWAAGAFLVALISPVCVLGAAGAGV
ncbi:MAG: hypothetical protein ACR2MA_09565 [Egibacteraceae bacterium]